MQFLLSRHLQSTVCDVKNLEGPKILPYLHASKEACHGFPGSKILAGDMKLEGQRQRTVLLVAQQRAEASCSNQLPLSSVSHRVMQASLWLRGRHSYVCQEIKSALSPEETLPLAPKTVWDQNCHKTCRNTMKNCPTAKDGEFRSCQYNVKCKHTELWAQSEWGNTCAAIWK